MTPDLVVFAAPPAAAASLAVVGLLAVGWSGGTVGWATVREAVCAAGLALRAGRE